MGPTLDSSRDLSRRRFTRRTAARYSLFYAALAAAWIVFSDRLMVMVVTDAQMLARLSTVKGLLFVGITALLLYAVLRRRARARDEDGAANGAEWLSPVLALALFFVALSGFGWGVCQSAKRSIAESTHDQLGAIARLKERQIQAWVQERREDVDLMVDAPLFAAEVRRWLEGGRRDVAAERRIADRLHQVVTSPRYREMALHALDGEVLLATSPHAESSRVRRLVEEVAARQRIVFDDLNGNGAEPAGFAINLFGPIGGYGHDTPLAIVHLAVEPADLLAPLLDEWPTADPSAETELLRREEDELLLLDTMRYRADAHGHLRIPLGKSDLVSVQAVTRSGPLVGHDYRGVPVLAYAQPVADTPWVIVTKVDQADAYATLDSLAITAAVMGGVLFLVSLWWWWERSREAATRYREQIERAVLAKRLDYLARYTSDGVMILDTDGNITDVNGRCLALHGYERQEMLGLPAASLLAQPLQERFPVLLQRLREEGSLTYEAEHRRKDGGTFPVEIGARALDLEGEPCIQLICRDITPRVQAERAIRERENLFDEFFHASPEGMFMLDREFRYLRVNEPLARLNGVPVESHYGRTVSEVLPRLAPVLEPLLRQVLEQEQFVLTTEVSGETPRLPGVNQHWIMSLFRIAGSGDRPAALGGVVVDISPRKRAEARILALSRLYATISAANQAIVRSASLQEVLREVCRACVTEGGFSLAWIGLAEAGEIVPAEAYGDAIGYLDGIVIRTGEGTPEGRGPTGTAYREQRVCVCNDLSSVAFCGPWHKSAAYHGLRASIALPLRCGGKVIGTLTVYGAEQNIFDDEAVELLTEMADNVSFAMDHFERERQRAEAEAALRQSEMRLQEAQAIGRIGSWEIDLSTWELSASPQLFRLYERDPAQGIPGFDEILGYYRPESGERMKDGVRRAITRGERVELELQVCLPSGLAACHSTTIEPERDATGWTVKLRGTTQDVTERKEAEKALAQYAAEVEALYQQAPCGYHSLDAEGRFCLINDTELRWLGYAREELVGCRTLAELVSAESRPAFLAHFHQLVSTGTVRDGEFDLVRKDGSVLPVLLRATAVFDGEGRFVMTRTTVYDMTERKKMEQERADHARRLAELSRNLVAMQEEERRRLASLLHDRTSPNLAAIQINLGMLADELRAQMPGDVEERLDDTLALLEDTTFGIRQICTELRPALLDYAGLKPALESFAQQFASRTGIAVHLDMDGWRGRLAADVETTLFRIVQEALTNCAKHAHARNVNIKLCNCAAGVELTIADDGVGFSPEQLGRMGKAPGLGLLTMRERAEFAGGRFSIHSRPGGGALIRVELAGCEELAVAAES